MASIARRKALALRGPATPMEYPSSARYIAHRLPMNGFGRRITHYQWRSKEFTDLTRQNTDKYEVMLGMKLYDHEWNTHRVHSCRVYKKKCDNPTTGHGQRQCISVAAAARGRRLQESGGGN
eukprot:scpid24616/ scgid32945/ 